MFKTRSSELRALLKIFKLRFDDLERLKQLEPQMRRLIFLSTTPQNMQWQGEGLHRLALMYEAERNIVRADQYYGLALEYHAESNLLGRALTMRDFGLFLVRNSSAEAGIAMIEEALVLHGKDLEQIGKNTKAIEKGERQQALTESYLWRAKLLIDPSDESAFAQLTEYALGASRRCSLRDQQRLIAFALDYSNQSTTHALLAARLVEVKARRRRIVGAIRSAARSIIETEIMIARAIVTRPFRKE